MEVMVKLMQGEEDIMQVINKSHYGAINISKQVMKINLSLMNYLNMKVLYSPAARQENP